MAENRPPDDELHIDLNLDDLDAEPLPAAAPPTGGDLLVITGDDLLDVRDEPVYPSAPAGGFPAVAGPGAVPLPGKKAATGFTGSLMLQMAIAGILGGVLAWAINEPQTLGADRVAALTAASVYLHTLVFFAIAGATLGLFLGAVEGITSLNYRKAVMGGLLALAIGGVGGAIAGVLGQAIYGALGGRGDTLNLTQIVARAMGWCIAGLFIGLGQGAAGISVKKIVNGLCGGALGGFAGGAVFDIVGMFMALTGAPGLLSRLIALVVIGAASGAAIGLIEELRKEAWVVIVGGALQGKQFILYRAQTTIGSSPKCDIALLKDPAVAPQHCVLEMTGTQCAVRDLGTPGGTLVNGRPVQRQALRRGDVIQIGQTALEYQDRALTAPPPGRPL